MPDQRVDIRANHLLTALHHAAAYGGTDRFGYVWFEFDTISLTVVATDGVQIMASQLTFTPAVEPTHIAVSVEDMPLVKSFLNAAGANCMLVLAEDYLGFSTGSRKLMVERQGAEPFQWREQMAARHVPGLKMALDSRRLTAVLASMPKEFILHLPEGDGQSIHLYAPGYDTEAWLMPLQTSEPGAMNQKGGGEALAPAEPIQ